MVRTETCGDASNCSQSVPSARRGSKSKLGPCFSRSSVYFCLHLVSPSSSAFYHNFLPTCYNPAFISCSAHTLAPRTSSERHVFPSSFFSSFLPFHYCNMSNLPRITLRPPPHRSFLSGYPGIGASSPSSSASSSDPLLTLPVVHRPAACLSGTVEVRLPVTKGGGGVKARWLRVELEKIESVPSPSGASGQDEGKKREAKYVELIGSGPGTLWEAGKGKEGMIKGGEEEAAQEVVKESPRKGRFKSIVGKKGSGPSRAEEEEEEDGWEAIPEVSRPNERGNAELIRRTNRGTTSLVSRCLRVFLLPPRSTRSPTEFPTN